ncbi:MAG: hypothetical protein ABEJ69_02115 [Candidatus Nanohaloarchaea archaeon]
MAGKHPKDTGMLAKTLPILAVLLIFSVTAVSGANAQNTLDVNVSIASETIIDIQPSKFSWGYGANSVFPGSIAGPAEELNGYGRIQIENLGSVNISQVWFNNTQPSQRPFGTGNQNAYDSANFLSIDRNSTSTDRNAFIDRKEYGLDQPTGKEIIYLNTPSGWDYGRFRNSSYEYFWTVDDAGTSLDSATFRIGIEHHNETQTGSTALDAACSGGDEAGSNTQCNGYTLNNVSVGGNYWAVTEVEIGVEDTTLASNDGGIEYCVAMDASQVMSSNPPEVEFIKWNKGHPAVNAAGAGSDCEYATNYTIGGSSPAGKLVPGEWITMNMRAKIPYGVVSGNLPTGNLFVLANSQ